MNENFIIEHFCEISLQFKHVPFSAALNIKRKQLYRIKVDCIFTTAVLPVRILYYLLQIIICQVAFNRLAKSHIKVCYISAQEYLVLKLLLMILPSNPKNILKEGFLLVFSLLCRKSIPRNGLAVSNKQSTHCCARTFCWGMLGN